MVTLQGPRGPEFFPTMDWCLFVSIRSGQTSIKILVHPEWVALSGGGHEPEAPGPYPETSEQHRNNRCLRLQAFGALSLQR